MSEPYEDEDVADAWRERWFLAEILDSSVLSGGRNAHAFQELERDVNGDFVPVVPPRGSDIDFNAFDVENAVAATGSIVFMRAIGRPGGITEYEFRVGAAGSGGSGAVTGTGTVPFLPKWATTTTLDDSGIRQDLTNGSIGIGMTPTAGLDFSSLDVAGDTIQFGTANACITYTPSGSFRQTYHQILGNDPATSAASLTSWALREWQKTLILVNVTEDMSFAVRRSSGDKVGADATTGGLTFIGGLYTGGTITGGGGGSGTVTSVGLTMPAEFSVGGSPVTTAGTLAVTWQNAAANTLLAGPTSGGAAPPTFRNIAPEDFGNQAQSTVLAGPVSGGAAPPTFRALEPGDFSNKAANLVAAGPASGGATAPTFRALVAADVGVTTKGDLLTFSTVLARLGVGTDGQVLTADSTQATGLKWAAAAAGGTTILDGAGPPGGGTGAVGNYYEDTTNFILYGPKNASGYGAEQRVTIGGAADSDNTAGLEVGTRVSFVRAGRVTKIRYYRRTGTSTSVNLRVWNAAGTLIAGPVSDATGAGTAGYQTVTLPTPVIVVAGDTMTFSLSAVTTNSVPLHFLITDTATNTLDCTVTQVSLSNGTKGVFPNTVGNSSVYVEPVYEPLQSWAVSVQSVPQFTSAAGGQVPASGGGTANFLRADGTWTPSVAADGITNAMLRDSLACSVIGRGANSAANPADIQATADNQFLRRRSNVLDFGTILGSDLDFTGMVATDPALLDEMPLYDVSVPGNRKATVERIAGFVNPAICEFRLTTESTVAVSTTDRPAQGTLYCVPGEGWGGHASVSGGARVALFDGTRWKLYNNAEIALAITGTASHIYDVFLYDNAGTLALEFADWNTGATFPTSRSSVSLALLDGVLVKSGATTRRYLGTFLCSPANQVYDTANYRYLWSYYHRARKRLRVNTGTGTYVYSGSAYRFAEGNAAYYIGTVTGVPEVTVDLSLAVGVNSTVLGTVAAFIGVNQPTSGAVPHADCQGGVGDIAAGAYQMVACRLVHQPGAGSNSYSYLELGIGSGTQTWLPRAYGGLTGWFEC